jgi:LPXTG-motif cell wall-anchored protein
MNLIGTMIRQKVASSTRMLLALALVLATLLLAAAAPAVPALAQEGVVDEDEAAQEEGAAKEGVDQEEGAAKEEIVKERVDHEEGVTKREAAREGASQGDKATLSFELTVEGEPPADAAFFGNVHTGEGGPGRYVPLADPEHDGVYTGSTIVDRFGPGPRPVPPGVEPVSFPVQIVQGTHGEAYRSIKDFGTVKFDGDKTFSAGVSFDDEEPNPEEVSATGRIGQIADFPGASHAITDEASGDRYFLTSDSVDLQYYAVSGERVTVYGTPVPNRYTTDNTLNVTRVEPAGTTPPPDGDGGSDNNGGSNNDSGSDDSGSDNSGFGGSGSGGSSGGSSGSIASGIRGVLPSTGGSMALTLLGAGVLMTGGGLLVRRLTR